MKIRLPNVLDVSKYLDTKSGQELKDLLQYMGEFTQMVIQALSGKLTFVDNNFCDVKLLNVQNGVETAVKTREDRPVSIVVKRVIDDRYYTVSSFGWKFNSGGQAVIKATFDGTPVVPIDIEVFIFY